MGAMASQITSIKIVYSAVYSGADQRKHQSSTSMAFVTGEFSAQRASNAENVSIWRRHHANLIFRMPLCLDQWFDFKFYTSWRVEWSSNRLFPEQLLHAYIKESIKALNHSPSVREPTNEWWFSFIRASNTENVSMSRHHHSTTKQICTTGYIFPFTIYL